MVIKSVYCHQTNKLLRLWDTSPAFQWKAPDFMPGVANDYKKCILSKLKNFCGSEVASPALQRKVDNFILVDSIVKEKSMSCTQIIWFRIYIWFPFMFRKFPEYSFVFLTKVSNWFDSYINSFIFSLRSRMFYILGRILS